MCSGKPSQEESPPFERWSNCMLYFRSSWLGCAYERQHDLFIKYWVVFWGCDFNAAKHSWKHRTLLRSGWDELLSIKFEPASPLNSFGIGNWIPTLANRLRNFELYYKMNYCPWSEEEKSVTWLWGAFVMKWLCYGSIQNSRHYYYYYCEIPAILIPQGLYTITGDRNRLIEIWVVSYCWILMSCTSAKTFCKTTAQ